MNGLEIAPNHWLESFEHDYLVSYLREGGAAVKVLVTEALAELTTGLSEVAQRHGFLTAHVDRAVLRINYMDRLFNEVARQVDWTCLASDCMRLQLGAHGYALPDGDPIIDEVASINGIDVGQVRITVEQVLSKSVVTDYDMASDFRLAMGQLCRSAVERDDMLRETANRIQEWLTGDLKMISALRSARLFERINRYNARAMLASLGKWARTAGRAGLLVTVDVSRFPSRALFVPAQGVEIRPPTLAAVMDTYEMMRQCIDGTDEMSGIAICFVAGPEFTQDDKRGMRAYPALEQRLTDDVRDRRRGNPHAPMVRLAAGWN
jgi:hypothetical protein